jgi:hypothetical protein
VANFAYFPNADNLLATAAVSSSGTLSGYPADNIKALPISQPVRLEGISAKWIEFDFGSAKTFNFIILINHNLSSAATATLTTGSSPAPGGNSTTIPWRKYDMFAGTPSHTFRYARISFTDSSNPDGFIQVGFTMLGVINIPSFNFAYGWERERTFHDSATLTDFGVDHVAELYDDTAMRLQFQNRMPGHMDELFALYEKLQGKRGKLFLMPDADVYDGYFGRIENSFLRRYDFYHSAELIFRSDSRGKKIGA